MDYTKEQFINLIKDEYSRIEGQLSEHDLTKEEFMEIEHMLVKIGEAIGINTYEII